MKFSAVIIPKNGLKKTEKGSSRGDYKLLLSFLSVFLGLLLGALIYVILSEKLKGSIWNLFKSFFSDFSNKTNPEIISGLVLSEIPYLVVMFILGLSAIGYPIVLVISTIKCMAPTLLFSYLYSAFGLKGAEYVFLVLALGKIIMLLGVIMVTHSSFSMSYAIKDILNENRKEYKTELKKYLLRSGVITLIFLMSCLLTFSTVKGFSSLFSF